MAVKQVTPYKPYDYEANRAKLYDTRGMKLSTGLFHELSQDPLAYPPVFSLKDWKRIYVDIADPTEYEAAMVLIGDWEHWQHLLSNPVFLRTIADWRKEVEVKLRSDAIVQLVHQSRGPKGAMAAKWLAEGGFAPRDKRTRKGKQEETEVHSEVKSRVAEDAQRLRLVGNTSK